ncbi:tRNA (guanosine(46)-N7)-methyltransferase TrmB [Calidifontibacter terrae]
MRERHLDSVVPLTADGRPVARNRSFTRRGGRMPERHEKVMVDHGPTYVLDLPLNGTDTALVADYHFDRAEAFGREAPLIVEIGSGAGDCVVHAAAARPDLDFLAFEVWRPGVAHTIAKAVAAEVTNLRIAIADAAWSLPLMMEPGSLHEVWTFFPDPWPKKKHHKRRMVQPKFALQIAELLEPLGSWRLATDWADYAWQMRDVVEDCPELVNPHAGRLADPGDPEVDPAGNRGGFAPRFELRPITRFEGKGLRVNRVVRDLQVTTR